MDTSKRGLLTVVQRQISQFFRSWITTKMALVRVRCLEALDQLVPTQTPENRYFRHFAALEFHQLLQTSVSELTCNNIWISELWRLLQPGTSEQWRSNVIRFAPLGRYGDIDAFYFTLVFWPGANGSNEV